MAPMRVSEVALGIARVAPMENVDALPRGERAGGPIPIFVD